MDPYLLHNVQITEPQPGRVGFIPGWRVCLSTAFKIPDYLANAHHPNPYDGPDIYPDSATYTDAKIFAYFFVNGSLSKIVPDDALVRALHL